jgi:hypothetical protein
MEINDKFLYKIEKNPLPRAAQSNKNYAFKNKN